MNTKTLWGAITLLFIKRSRPSISGSRRSHTTRSNWGFSIRLNACWPLSVVTMLRALDCKILRQLTSISVSSSTTRILLSAILLPLTYLSVKQRQIDTKLAALSHFRFDLDSAAMRFDDTVTYRKTQSSPFALLFGGKKGTEYFIEILFGDTHARIQNGQAE